MTNQFNSLATWVVRLQNEPETTECLKATGDFVRRIMCADGIHILVYASAFIIESYTNQPGTRSADPRVTFWDDYVAVKVASDKIFLGVYCLASIALLEYWIWRNSAEAVLEWWIGCMRGALDWFERNHSVWIATRIHILFYHQINQFDIIQGAKR